MTGHCNCNGSEHNMIRDAIKAYHNYEPRTNSSHDEEPRSTFHRTQGRCYDDVVAVNTERGLELREETGKSDSCCNDESNERKSDSCCNDKRNRKTKDEVRYDKIIRKQRNMVLESSIMANEALKMEVDTLRQALYRVSDTEESYQRNLDLGDYIELTSRHMHDQNDILEQIQKELKNIARSTSKIGGT